MKQAILKRFMIAGIALVTIPSTLLAQKEKEGKESKDKKEVQSIVITRTGDKNEKMTVVVDGDKVTVNGKDLKDLKDADVHVNVNTVKGSNVYRLSTGQPRTAWSMNMNDDGMTLFSEDENRAMLGVNTEDNAKGAEIQSVTEGSAAEKAGLKKGDIITRVGDTKIATPDDLSKAIKDHKPGEKVNIAYLRDGKEQKVSTELGKWKGFKMEKFPRVEALADAWKGMDNLELPRAYSAQGYYFSGRPKLGLSIQDTEDGNGVKVLDVEEESNAAKAGIQKDDIILSIDDTQVKGTDDVIKTVRENKEKYNFNFKIQRGGKLQTIEVKFPKKLKTTDL